MSDTYTMNDVLSALVHASKVLDAHKDEVNRLNVFPVPDGDTGTNMSLTMQQVVSNVQRLSSDASKEDISKAITNGALMGARGNSGVISSQILRGICQGGLACEKFDTKAVDTCFSSAVTVAFKAVRKPVEGTILTVLRDAAQEAHKQARKKADLEKALPAIVKEAYASVQRTPDLLPVLKENNVVDSGAFGFAILLDGFTSALLHQDDQLGDESIIGGKHQPVAKIEQVNDWDENSKFTYCNEFLVYSDTLDPEKTLDFLQTIGDCELCVGTAPLFKVHVHSNHPDKVLHYFLERGEIAKVFIHNMKKQSLERTESIEADAEDDQDAQDMQASSEHKSIGVVAVAAGAGNAKILRSLGVDYVVSGGQTMNPSTQDLLSAVNKVNADSVIILPDNGNIIMAAQSCAEVSEKPVGVVPTKSVPAAFTAMFSLDRDVTLQENVSAMTDALEDVQTGEITTAIKDSHDASGKAIKKGDVIGIADGKINAVGSSIEDVLMDLLATMHIDDFDNITLLAGKDLDDDQLHRIADDVSSRYDDIDVDAHRGDQPLYPLVFSVE